MEQPAPDISPAGAASGWGWHTSVVDIGRQPAEVLQLWGEIDACTLPEVRAVLEREPLHGRRVILDLGGLAFCSISGVQVLADTLSRLTSAGHDCILLGLSPQLHRVATLIWPENHILITSARRATGEGSRAEPS